ATSSTPSISSLSLHDALPIYDDVFLVFFKKRVCFKELVDAVNALGLDLVVANERFLSVQPFFLRNARVVFNLIQLYADLRKNKELGIFALAGYQVNSFFSQLYAVIFFFDNKEKGLVCLRQQLFVFRQVDGFRLLQDGPNSCFTEELDQRLVFGHTPKRPEERQPAVLFVSFGDQFFGFVQILCDKLLLGFHQLEDTGLQFIEFVFVATRYGPRNKQRCPGFVDKDGVDFVDHSVVVTALYQLLGIAGHVVAQIVETEFVVGAIRDIGAVRIAPGFGGRPVLVDAVHVRAVEHEQRTHPFAVAAGQVVVNGHDMDPSTRKRVEECRKCSHQRLSFPRGHFGNLAFMEGDTTDDLHVVVDHVPCDLIAGRHPFVEPAGFVTDDLYVGVRGRKRDVVGFRRDFEVFVLFKSPGGFAYDGEGFWQDSRQCLLKVLISVFLQGVNLAENGLL